MKVKNIILDLDGVIRNLAGEVIKQYWEGVIYTNWNQKLNGMNLTALVNKDLSILERCQPTEYYTTIRKYYPIPTIWSYQHPEWIKLTTDWLSKYFIDFNLEIKNNDQKFEALHKEDCDVFLVEDYPLYEDYNKMVLIDRPYNQEAKAEIRIHSPKELEKFILEEE